MGIPTKIHPLTGQPIRPLWIRPDGRAMWPILGASDDPPAADPPANPPSDPPADPPADLGKQPPWGKPENFNADKAWELIENLRAEKGDPKKVAQLEKQLADAQAAQQAQLDGIAKALGLKDDTPPDPAALAAKVTEAETRATDAEKRSSDAERKLAVFLAAGAHDANPAALVDSTSFMASVADLAPTDAEKLAEAIKAAVEKNPAFKATPPAPPFPGGPRKTPAPPDPGPGLARLRAYHAAANK